MFCFSLLSFSHLNVCTSPFPPPPFVPSPASADGRSRKREDGGVHASPGAGGGAWGAEPQRDGPVAQRCQTRARSGEQDSHVMSHVVWSVPVWALRLLPFSRLWSCCWRKAPTWAPPTNWAARRWCWLPPRAMPAPLSSCCPKVRDPLLPRRCWRRFPERPSSRGDIFCLCTPQAPPRPLQTWRDWQHSAGPAWRPRRGWFRFWWRREQTWTNQTDRDGRRWTSLPWTGIQTRWVFINV